VAALRLPARVQEDPTLGPLDEAPIDIALGVQDEIGMAGIIVSPSKPGMGGMKLSRACRHT
jgi:hypothetical protein